MLTIKGGGALYGHTGMYPLNRTLIEGLDMVDTSIRDLDQSRLGPVLTNDPEALKKMGYTLEDQGWEMGDIQAIRVNGDKLETASDPRGRGVGMIVK